MVSSGSQLGHRKGTTKMAAWPRVIVFGQSHKTIRTPIGFLRYDAPRMHTSSSSHLAQKFAFPCWEEWPCPARWEKVPWSFTDFVKHSCVGKHPRVPSAMPLASWSQLRNCTKRRRLFSYYLDGFPWHTRRDPRHCHTRLPSRLHYGHLYSIAPRRGANRECIPVDRIFTAVALCLMSLLHSNT